MILTSVLLNVKKITTSVKWNMYVFNWSIFYVMQFYAIFLETGFRPLRPEDGGSVDFWNVGILPQHYTASQPKTLRLETSPPLKPKNLQYQV